uniref:Trehalase n=1 Tax=Heterorhabditis bacteriophora TaxID=37862 RepID=A0A1I7XF55_HETBA
MNTYLAMASGTVTTFLLSSLVDNLGRFNMIHIQSSTLAGGVAIGSAANAVLYPSHAVAVGVCASSISVIGHAWLSGHWSSNFQPKLEKRFKLFDTCGVHNLHGIPGILSGVLSIVFALGYEPESYGKTLVNLHLKLLLRNADFSFINCIKFSFYCLPIVYSFSYYLLTGYTTYTHISRALILLFPQKKKPVLLALSVIVYFLIVIGQCFLSENNVDLDTIPSTADLLPEFFHRSPTVFGGEFGGVGRFHGISYPYSKFLYHLCFFICRLGKTFNHFVSIHLMLIIILEFAELVTNSIDFKLIITVLAGMIDSYIKKTELKAKYILRILFQVLPVDLNAFICWNLDILEYLFERVEDVDKSELYREERAHFRNTVHNVFYNRTAGTWYIFICFFITLSYYLHYQEQWDFPNGWSNLNHMMVEGLRKSQNAQMQDVGYFLLSNYYCSTLFSEN